MIAVNDALGYAPFGAPGILSQLEVPAAGPGRTAPGGS
jgi:hypothetical protein